MEVGAEGVGKEEGKKDYGRGETWQLVEAAWKLASAERAPSYSAGPGWPPAGANGQAAPESGHIEKAAGGRLGEQP